MNCFKLFEPYKDRLDVRLFTKEDSMLNDADTERVLRTPSFISLNQVHGNTTEIVRSPSKREKVADGSLTDERALWLTIRVADCQSFVIYVPGLEVIGVLHAGWKGLVNGMIPRFFDTMQREWNVDPSTILMAAGPSFCTTCAEFTDPVRELPGIDARFFNGRHVDLRAIADDQCTRAGVLPQNMERHPDCTKCMQDTYWSYRGDDKEDIQKGFRNILAITLL